MKIGYKASAEQFDRAQLLEYGVLAESVGMDSVWISDHFKPWRPSVMGRCLRVTGAGHQHAKNAMPVSEPVFARVIGRIVNFR